MPNLKDIKKRITSVESTKQITRTMEMVATAKIRRATDRIVSATPYATAMLEVLDAVTTKASGTESPLLQTRAHIKRIVVICVVSDRGLAGGFNYNVLRATDRFIQGKIEEGIACDVIACGKRGLPYFKYRNIPLALSFCDQSADPQLSQAREIASYIIKAYTAGRADQVILFYNHSKNVADQVTLTEQVLPVDRNAFAKDEHGDEGVVYADEGIKAVAASQKRVLGAARERAKDVVSADSMMVDFDYEPSASAVLDALIPSYIETRVFHALLDSAAGEQAARRKAMKSATDNATEILTTLTRVYNRVRQGAITTEITEIVGGAAALEE